MKIFWHFVYYSLVAGMIVLFGITSANKFTQQKDFREGIENTWLLDWLPADVLAWAIPAVIVSIAAGLAYGMLNPKIQYYTLRAYFGLVALFTVFIVILLTDPDRLPCQCLGIDSGWTWWTQLTTNLVILSGTLTAIGLHDKWIVKKQGMSTPKTLDKSRNYGLTDLTRR